MNITARHRFVPLIAAVFAMAAFGTSHTNASETDDTAVQTTVANTTQPADSTTGASMTAATTVDAAGGDAVAITSLFADGALSKEVAIVSCTLEGGTETTCYQLEVASLVGAVDTDGPFCPDTVDVVGGIWVWDGDDPGLYVLDADFWAMMKKQGYDFVDADGNITITDPRGAGGVASGGTANSCLEATADGSFHLQVLLPTETVMLDAPVSLGEVSQVGIAVDGVTIFGDAPSVADRGGLPALDACGGHIDPSGYYHWHFGAESIQTNLDDAGAEVTCAIEQDVEALMGFSYDGSPIYGPEEDGEIPSGLDKCSGHVSNTEEFGEVYHYHLTYDSPNLPACRVGAAAIGALSSPDNANVALPGGTGGPGGGPDGPPPGDG